MSRARRKKGSLTRLPVRPEWVARALFAATCLLATAGTSPARAADGPDRPLPWFESFPGNDVLPDRRVVAIASDHEGFLWLATVTGLVRYHGYSLRELRSDPGDPNTLSDDVLRTLLVERDGLLWAGAWNAGLNRVDPRTGRVTRLRHDPPIPEA